METVLVIGSTGNIGTGIIQAALRSKRHVLAVVRNQSSAEKLFRNVGTREGITTVDADVTSDTGVQGVVDQVWAGKLPAFQHVFASVGGGLVDPVLSKVDPDLLRFQVKHGLETNFLAYRATLPYLIEQNNPKSSWTLITGALGDLGFMAANAITQGALQSLAAAACKETEGTNVRFVEIYLAATVAIDANVGATGAMRASVFGRVYENILEKGNLKGCRVIVQTEKDVDELRVKPKGVADL